MIRQSLLAIYVLTLCVIAFRDWYWALCMLLWMTVFCQHPSMPKLMFGVPGLNPWNFCFLVIVIFWLVQRHHETVRKPPSHLVVLLSVFYMLIIAASGLYGALDAGSILDHRYDAQGMFLDGVLNPLKFAFLGYLFFDGTITRARAFLALFTVVWGDLTYGLMMFKTINIRIFTIEYNDARRLTDKLIGLFANDLAQVLAFAIWAGLLMAVLFKRREFRTIWLLIVLSVVPPFIVLKSRAGYIGLCTAGLMLGVIRYRAILVALPLTAASIWFFLPGVRERFTVEDNSEEDITAGRMTHLWPPVIATIKESPIVGHGRLAILRESCYATILAGEGEVPTTPHNAYLEMLLDTGAIGLLVVVACMVGITKYSLILMRMKYDPLFSTLGVVSLIAVTVLMTVGLSGASFYPQQSTVPYLCLWGVIVRMRTETKHAVQSSAGPAVFQSTHEGVGSTP